MAKMYQPPSENGKQTTLDGQASQGSSTVTLADASGLQFPGVIVVDRIDANGNETPTKREYIAFTGISSNTLTGCTRGLGGSTDQVHSDGAIAEAVVDVVWGQGVYDGFNTEHEATDGTHSDIHADSIELGGAGATADSIKDEDDMASDSATALATQQSIKAYVDTEVANVDVGSDGWLEAGETWTYASATSFTIAGSDLTSKYYKGAKIKLTQSTGGTKYFFVDSSSFSTNTTVNLVENETHELANEAISSPYYSYQERPQGFPDWMYTTNFKAGTTTTTSTTQSAVINYNKEIHDPGNNYDTSNKRYTIPISGLYYFKAQAAITSPDDQSRYGLSIRINSSGLALIRDQASGTSSMYTQTSVTSWRTAGETVDVSASFDSTESVFADDTFTFFEGHLITPGTTS